jgi:hypothetical protein
MSNYYKVCEDCGFTHATNGPCVDPDYDRDMQLQREYEDAQQQRNEDKNDG